MLVDCAGVAKGVSNGTRTFSQSGAVAGDHLGCHIYQAANFWMKVSTRDRMGDISLEAVTVDLTAGKWVVFAPHTAVKAFDGF